MEKNNILKAIKEIRDKSKKRQFEQSFDLVINLKNIDIKKTENQKEIFLLLPYAPKKKKVAALIGGELKEEAKNCDFSILADDFPNYAKDKKATKKLADEHDFIIAQANIMPQVATNFGRIFGPRGKMPNPKSGCVVPPKAQLKPVYEKLQKTVKASWKKSLVVQVLIATEKMSDEHIAENITTYYNAVIHQLPNELNNIKSVYLKLTMGSPVKIS